MNEHPEAITFRSRIFYGWWVLIALCATTFYIAGSFFWGFSLFFAELLEEFGWERAEASLALTFMSLESSVAAPLVGYLIERVGARRLMAVGLSLVGIGFILLSQITSLITFYGAFVLVATGTSAGAGIASQTLVVKWFVRRRGRATTTLMVMPGLGATVIIPILTVMIATFGWRQSLFLLGIGMWIIAVPVLLTVRNSPESMGLRPDGDAAPQEGEEDGGDGERSFTLREAMRIRTFWLLAGGFMLWNFAGLSVQPHLFVALEGIEFSRERAAAIVALVPALTIVGRLGFGFLSDYMDKRKLLMTSALSQSIGLACLAALMANPTMTWLTVPYLAFFSIGFGGFIPTRIVTVGQYFGRGSFGMVFGIIQGISTWGSMVGPVFSGWVFDTSGSYFAAFAIGSAVLVLIVPVVWLATNPQPSRAAVSAPADAPSPAPNGDE